MEKQHPRTDLAMEANEWLKEQNKSPHDGIVTSKINKDDGITVDVIEVTNDEASKQLNKVKGKYITIDAPHLRERDLEVFDKISHYMVDAMKGMITDEMRKKGVLIIGLGNRYVTADALGPKVVEKTMVTRHLLKAIPDQVDSRVRPVSAVAPGVLGITGIETEEMVAAIKNSAGPGAIIAVDALAARSVSRISNTIQISDTGIQPGAGVGNKQKGLTKESLGVPVIAVGTPTVVYATTIVNDALGGENATGINNDQIQDMIVTPKEIDQVIEDMSKIISMGLNLLIHEGVSAEEVNTFLN